MEQKFPSDQFPKKLSISCEVVFPEILENAALQKVILYINIICFDQFCFRITNSPIADVFIVWANCEDKRIRGFILEKVRYIMV